MPQQLKIAAIAAVVLVLGISALGTAASWRADGNIDAGLISTGSLSLTAGNGTSAQQDYGFTELTEANGTNLVPGAFAQAPLTLSNAGTTQLNYALVAAPGILSSPTTADTALAAAVVLSVHSGMSSADCKAGQPLSGTRLYSGPLGADAKFAAPRSLAKPGAGTSAEVLCVRLAISSGAPQTAAGGKLNLVLRFSAEQR